VIDFLGFRPSVVAAAAVISAAGGGVDVPESYFEKVNKVLILDFVCVLFSTFIKHYFSF